MIDTAFWWIGAIVAFVSALSAICIVVAAMLLVSMRAVYRRAHDLGYTGGLLRLAKEWDKAGRPKWHVPDEPPYTAVMRLTQRSHD